MAEIIVENREFTDRQTGIKTEYEYYAIKGQAADGNIYEVQLKNLVQSEKVALKMMSSSPSGTVHSRKTTKEEEENFLNENSSNKGMFD